MLEGGGWLVFELKLLKSFGPVLDSGQLILNFQFQCLHTHTLVLLHF